MGIARVPQIGYNAIYFVASTSMHFNSTSIYGAPISVRHCIQWQARQISSLYWASLFSLRNFLRKEPNSVSLGNTFYQQLLPWGKPTLQKLECMDFHKQYSKPSWETHSLSAISLTLTLCKMKGATTTTRVEQKL